MNLPPSMRERFLAGDLPSLSTDYSGAGRADDFEEDNGPFPNPGFTPNPNDDSILNLNDLDRDYFRSKLIENFAIRLRRADVVWPRANS